MTEGMTMNDYLVLEKVGNRNKGVANTALGLGIGLGTAALAGVIAVGWGLNSASKARSRAAEQMYAANSAALDRAINVGTETTKSLANLIGVERASRETWQAAQQPTIGQYVDVQTNPNLQATLQDYVSAMATATATANANSPLNAAIGSEHFLKVQRYSAPQPCGCDSCGQ